MFQFFTVPTENYKAEIYQNTGFNRPGGSSATLGLDKASTTVIRTGNGPSQRMPAYDTIGYQTGDFLWIDF